MKINFNALICSLIILCSVLGCESRSDGVAGTSLITLTGKAYYPPQLTSEGLILAKQTFQVLDFQRAPGREVVAQGVTDEEGNYFAETSQSKSMAVVVSGKVRVSGLISADPNQFDGATTLIKDFDGVTDIACEAGVTAIQDGSVSPDEMDDKRIRNLELAAQLVENEVSYLDFTSVSAAARKVRQMTSDGAHAPAL